MERLGGGCNHSGNIVDVGRGIVRCGCGQIGEPLQQAFDRLRAHKCHDYDRAFEIAHEVFDRGAKEIVELRAEVERLRGIDQASVDGANAFFTHKPRDANPHPPGDFRVAWWGGYDSAKNAEALRRVVEVLERTLQALDRMHAVLCSGVLREGDMDFGELWVEVRQSGLEALAFARGVASPAAAERVNEDTWVRVEDGMPKHGHTVVVILDGEKLAAIWNGEKWFMPCFRGSDWLPEKAAMGITHWMPLPPLKPDRSDAKGVMGE